MVAVVTKICRKVLGFWFIVLVPAPATGDAAPVRPRAIESKQQREKLPLYDVIPAARPEELTAANGYPTDEVHRTWDRSHGNNHNTRFSLLDQINRQNVGKLKVAWIYRSADRQSGMTDNLQANPIVVNGVMYGPTMGHRIVAVDAARGKELWRFDAGARPAWRGLTFARGDGKSPSRLLFNAGEFLWALDPKTGKPLPSFGKEGRLETGHFRVAPVVHGNLAIVSGFNKDVIAYDMVTGELAWTFHTIPGLGEFGFDTWERQPTASSSGAGMGANGWGGIALDDERGIVYVATAAPKSDFIGSDHRGQNLFANCVIAIDARTGKRLWHFQEVRHDIWDLDFSAPPVLVTVSRHGKKVDAVAAIGKFGNTVLLDRVTGKPLFPFRLRRAPVSTLPGEQTWPYQPDLELPQPFAKQEFTIDDITDISPQAHEYILNKVRPMKRGWFEPFEMGRPTVLFGVLGGAEWTGAAFDPRSGYFYVNAHDVPTYTAVIPFDAARKRDPRAPPTAGQKVYDQLCLPCHGADRRGVGMGPPLLALETRYQDEDVVNLLKTGRNGMPVAPPLPPQQQKDLLDFLFDRDLPRAKTAPAKNQPPSYAHLGYNRLYDQEGYPGSKPPWGTLNALDLNLGRIVWKTPLGEHEELTKRGVPKTGTMNLGGAIVTAGGLVFCSGTKDLMIRAFEAASGDELWAHKLPFRGTAPPTTYEVGGKQYVVITATGGGKLGGEVGDAYVAFALP